MNQDEQSGTSRRPLRLIRAPELRAKLGIGTTTQHVWVKEGKLPPPVRLGTRNIAWFDYQVEEWMAARVKVEASSS